MRSAERPQPSRARPSLFSEPSAPRSVGSVLLAAPEDRSKRVAEAARARRPAEQPTEDAPEIADAAAAARLLPCTAADPSHDDRREDRQELRDARHGEPGLGAQRLLDLRLLLAEDVVEDAGTVGRAGAEIRRPAQVAVDVVEDRSVVVLEHRLVQAAAGARLLLEP